MSPPQVTSRAFQHSSRQRHRDALMPTGFWYKKGRMIERERNCIYFCPSSVKGLTKCVGVLNCGCWIKYVVAWEWGSTYVSCLFESVKHKNLLFAAPKNLFISSWASVSQSASSWMHFWTNLVESTLIIGFEWRNMCLTCLMMSQEVELFLKVRLQI